LCEGRRAIIRQDQLDRLSEIIRQAQAAGNAKVLAEATELLGRALRQMAGPGTGADPMTRAHAREADGLHELRKGRDSCSATRRDGEPCQAPAIEEGLVCRRHGGASPQVQIAARHRQLQMQRYVAYCEWQGAKGTPREFDALCRALQAGRELDAYEAKLERLAELRVELRRSGALDGTRRTP